MLRIYNSLTCKLEPFTPGEDMKVKMYTCGPSTYQPAHIGNYRTFLFEDILQRYLEFLGYKVKRLMTLTDIEDKAIAQAKEDAISVEELTNRNEAEFFRTFEQLNIKRPDYSVRASSIVGQAVALIDVLLDKGIAYNYNYKGAENIYFDPRKFSGFAKLAHLDMKKWPKKKRRFHLDTYRGMPWNKGDFVLWHGCKDGEKICWDTELGRGRPAWNIQDAAMVTKHLGYSVDVACGGIDNLVRHHDYTLAVAEAASGKSFARYWLHGGHLYVNGKKMSKSKGNVIYLKDLVARGYKNKSIRFFLVYGSYRKKLNFTWQNLAKKSRQLEDFRCMVHNLQESKKGKSSALATLLAHGIVSVFAKHMDNNLDVKSAFDAISKTTATLQRLSRKGKLSADDAKAVVADLRRVDDVLQFIF